MKRDYSKINGVSCQKEKNSVNLSPVVVRIYSEIIGNKCGVTAVEKHVIERLSALTSPNDFSICCAHDWRILEVFCESLDKHIDNVLSLNTAAEKIEYWLSQEYGLVPHYLRNRDWVYVTRVPIGEINYSHELRHLNGEIINKYFDIINNPILLCDSNNKLLDGYHRLCAAIRLKKKYVNVIRINNS